MTKSNRHATRKKIRPKLCSQCYRTILNSAYKVSRCVPTIYLSQFPCAWDTSPNKNRDPSFCSGEEKRQKNLERLTINNSHNEVNYIVKIIQ